MAKKNTKWSRYGLIGPGGSETNYSIWSSGKDTPKVTTLGKTLIKFMPPHSSDFIAKCSLQPA
jgi:hypothetical protein